MNANTEQRKLSAIMFTEMVGYSALAQRNEALAIQLLEEHRGLLRALFPRFNGREVKTIGDAFLVEFQSALEAAQCAIEIQRTLAKRNHDVPGEMSRSVHKQQRHPILWQWFNVWRMLPPIVRPNRQTAYQAPHTEGRPLGSRCPSAFPRRRWNNQ